MSLGGSRYDPTDPIGRLLFNVLGLVAEFERDLISMRIREGMAVARPKGDSRGSIRSSRRLSVPFFHDRVSAARPSHRLP
ncbi:recombinase family protein [Micromonospora sp. DT81.3]|uniref:recombinase family protein n=1 Tax=Micromonospora sp. DT81.3 TaxID=3416523 RepID=UPI003CF7F103